MKVNNLLKKMKTGNKGITLIALVVTIIVLLILVGVTVATLTGENGILTQAKNAKKEMTKAEAKERIQLEVLGSYGTDGEIDIATLKANIAKNIPEASIGSETELPLTVTIGDYTFTVKANGVVEEATPTVEEAVVGEIVTGENKPYTKNGTAIIPVGFAIVPGLDDVSEGLVISDKANDINDEGNQFVWIPVTKENPFKIRAGYVNESLQDISGYGEADSEGVNSILENLAAGSGSQSGSESSIKEESAETQAEAIEMYASVVSNEGFYIGRYETGRGSGASDYNKVYVKKGESAYTDIKWGNSMADETGGAVELARNFAEDNNYNTTKVHSTLCYSVQWDAALNFIDPGYKGYAKDSTKMGWYSDNYNTTSTGNNETNPNHIAGKDLIYNSAVGNIPAGKPTNKHKNIYDMAGNVSEWTMEAYSTYRRASRGGYYLNAGSNYPASYRDSYNPSNTWSNIGFRLALYL